MKIKEILAKMDLLEIKAHHHLTLHIQKDGSGCFVNFYNPDEVLISFSNINELTKILE